MSPALRQRLVAISRIVLAALLLWYLAASGIIDWSQLRGLWGAWPLTLAALGMVVLSFVLISWRFCILAGARGMHISLAMSMRLSLIGNAASLFIPAVGSDVARLIFAGSGQAGRRTEIATILLLDRILGMIGLLLLPVLLAPFFADLVRSTPVVLPLVVMSGAVSLGTIAGVSIALSRRAVGSRIVQWLLRTFPLRGYPRRVLETIHGYRQHAGVLGSAIAWSVAADVLGAGAIVLVSTAMARGGEGFELSRGFLASLAFVVNGFPITPGGLGVTEAAFAGLFARAGLQRGAEAMIAYRLLLLMLAPLGVAFYARGARTYLRATVTQQAEA